MKVKPDKPVTFQKSPDEPVLPELTAPEKNINSSLFQQIEQLIKEYTKKLSTAKKSKDENPIKIRPKRFNNLEKINFEVLNPKIDEKVQEEIIKIAQEQKEEEIRKSESNEIINENLNNINNIEEIKEEEEENIINENKIEDPKEREGENPNNDDNFEDILGNLPEDNYEVGKDEININRENNIEPLDENINININNDIISAQEVSKEEFLDINSLYNSFFLVSFSKNFKFLDYYINIKADCHHEECNGLPSIKPEIIYKYQLKKKRIIVE